MKFSQISILVIVCIFGLSCSTEPIPDHYGVFIVSKGRLIELQRISWDQLGKSYEPNKGDILTFGEKNIIDIDDSNIYFITFGMGKEEPILLPASQKGEKYEVLYPTPPEFTGGVKRYPAIEEFEIMPIEGKQEMYRIKPKTYLTSGVYLFSIVGCEDNPRDFRCFYPFRIH